MRVGSAGRRSWAPIQIGGTPTGNATILTPTPLSTVAGIILFSGLMPTSKPITAVDVRYDAAAYRPASWRGGKWRTLFNTTILSAGSHTLSVRVTYVDTSIALASVPITIPASTMIPGLAILKLGNAASYGSVTNRDKFSIFQVDQVQATIDDVVTRSTIALIWMFGTTCPKWNPTYNAAGVSYNECIAKGWIQKTAGNADVEYSGDPGQVFTRFGNLDYQTRVVDRFVNNPNQIADHNGTFLPGIFAQYPGIKGVTTDDVNASYSASGTTPSADYPTSVAWRDAMFDFIKGVGGGIQDAGFIYGCNPNCSTNEFVNASVGPKYSWPAWGQAHDGSQLSFWLRAMAPYLDIAQVEYWMAGGSGAGYHDSVKTLGTASNQAFREYLNNVMPKVNAAGGSSLMCNLQVGMTADNGADDTNLNSVYNQARMIYLKASFLLKWDPTTGTTCDLTAAPGNYSSAVDPWNISWTKNMGLPLGDMTEPVSGGFLRRFENGNVFLNANPSTSVTFPAPDNLAVSAKTAVIT